MTNNLLLFYRNAVLLICVLQLVACSLAPGIRAPDDAIRIQEIDKPVLVSVRDSVSQSPLKQAQQKQTLATHPTSAVYRIGPRDTLKIIVWNHPKLLVAQGDKEGAGFGFQVEQDGTFFFPYVGKLKAAGKTTDEVRRELERKLSKSIKTPQISVAITSYASQRVYVLGEVKNPRLISLQGYPLTIMEAIANAGGYTEHASRLKAYLLRDNERIDVPMADIMKKGQVQLNQQLKDGDVLHIPDNRSEKVYVTGEVLRPKSVNIVSGELSLSEALMESGGMNPVSADATNVYVIRATEDNQSQIFHLNMEEADALILGESFGLQSRDVIYVSTAKITQWNRVLGLIMPSLQTLLFMDILAKD